ncbi:MAG TPA: TIGR00282 family metallophosphoesterase [Arenicellales bacterium]|nr:TIGR00282 family metallophosphoesterase [Arenicellales bacterium]
MFKILFIGDVVGRSGRRVLLDNLETLQRTHDIDYTVVNAENAAAGFGITQSIADDLLGNGADVLTSGNHIWDKRETLEFIVDEPRLLRPENYPEGTPGSGWYRTRVGDLTVGVLNTMGTVFMHPTLDCPFRCADRVLQSQLAGCDIVMVDFHGEASSEKVAMGWYLNGRVSAVVGTHTHVPTADERVLPGGTAFISDVGMTGCYDSIIGMQIEPSLKRFLHKVPERFEVSRGRGTLCGVVITIDPQSGHATGIERVRIDEPAEAGGESA